MAFPEVAREGVWERIRLKFLSTLGSQAKLAGATPF
jgi:hypothetical protein